MHYHVQLSTIYIVYLVEFVTCLRSHVCQTNHVRLFASMSEDFHTFFHVFISFSMRPIPT